jgi:hypothetical protein
MNKSQDRFWLIHILFSVCAIALAVCGIAAGVYG